MAHQDFIDTEDFPPAKIPMISTIQHVPLYKSESFLRTHYLEKMMSIRQIAELTFSTRSAVVGSLKQHDIPIRTVDEAHKLRKGQVAFGRRVVRSKEIEHKRELENIQKMHSLRVQGYSYWKIAEIFNSMGVPTKTRKAKWHPATIMKILKHTKNNNKIQEP